MTVSFQLWKLKKLHFRFSHHFISEILLLQKTEDSNSRKTEWTVILFFYGEKYSPSDDIHTLVYNICSVNVNFGMF